MAQKVSVIIPNFNGRNLLARNLPQVIKYCTSCEIIVVDDASVDDSVVFVRKNYRKIKLVRLNKNRGFAFAANTGAKAARGNYLLFLNSDVAPKPDFLSPALKHFKDKNIFAVALADLSHEGGRVVIRGRGGAFFNKGFLNHFAAAADRGETFWVSGGSGLFDKKKFLMLGGFDLCYAPFYWEDIDLSYRARLSGFKCIFEPLAKVDHFHESGAIKKFHGPLFIKTVSYRNQLIFIWKNISDPMLLMKHLVWLPYHFLTAPLSFDLPFFLGFIWALLKLPALIFNYQSQALNYKLSDKEVLKNFGKS